MVRELAETTGDQSINFAFVNLFPNSAKEFIEQPVNQIYSYAVKLGIVKQFNAAATGTMLDKTTVYDRQKY